LAFFDGKLSLVSCHSLTRHPQESFGFQRLWVGTTTPLEVALADSCGCLDPGWDNEESALFNTPQTQVIALTKMWPDNC
jgi:hypothetical protein